tara:strand:+ start:769 stop:1200 length:432 start_codon:yes stop_codon:yes gene_type:complete
MAVQILSRRSSVLHDRPFPTRLGSAELAVNNNASEPGLFFADNTSAPSTGLVKIGPISVGTTQPNVSAAGFTGNSKGESWLDTNSTHILQVYDGSNWQTVKAVASIHAGLPTNPIDGQLHYNKTTNKLVIYDLSSTNWINIGP